MNRIKLVVKCLIIILIVFSGRINIQAQSLIKDYQTEYKPLEWIELAPLSGGMVFIQDGDGNEYFRQAVKEKVKFQVGGALGTQTVFYVDDSGKLLKTESFHVNCKTGIKDEKGEFSELMDIAYWTMVHAGTEYNRFDGKIYNTFAGWEQDHIHTMKGMKYYYADLEPGIDFYANSQANNGRIYDFYHENLQNIKHYTQRYGKQYLNLPDNKIPSDGFFIRTPIENMSEFHFLEGLYYAWKATGDDKWMESRLDNAIKVVNYCTSDTMRWSKQYKLLKRGHTIDIWDFLPEDEARRFGDYRIVMTYPDKSQFGILFADNIGLAVGCDYLSEMLKYAGRNAEAAKIKSTGEGLRARTDAMCWTGKYYDHWIPIENFFKNDFGGTDESTQVTLSNAYVLNKGISHDKCVKIIQTYQNIRKEMPASSPGEWYLCYPPYEKGWHMDKWEYMNGGVSPIVAGELSHGAFVNGYEDYAVDILRRIHKLAVNTGYNIKCVYRGAMPDVPERTFTPLDLSAVSNADLRENKNPDVPGWINEGADDLSSFPTGEKTFKDIPFRIIDPRQNHGKACIGLSGDPGYLSRAVIPVNKKAASVYLLHVMHDPAFTISHSPEPNGKYYAGSLVFHYTDGTSYTRPLTNDQVGWYHFPRTHRRYEWPTYASLNLFEVAWEGANTEQSDIGMYVTGFNNPFPDKVITSLECKGADTHMKWMVAGMTLSDKPVFFMPSKVSFGAPDNWAAAAITYALVEGLAGVKDLGVAYDSALIAPRWEAAGEKKATVTVKYEASGGYVAYTYDFEGDNLSLNFTGTSKDTRIKLLIPDNKQVRSIKCDGKAVDYSVNTIEHSGYAVFSVKGEGVKNILAGFSDK